MNELLANMQFLCDEARMLTGITVAFGTEHESTHILYGRAQEITRDAEENFIPCVRPLLPDSLFDLASLSKLFTAVLTMMLVERGRLSLDESVGVIDQRFIHLREVSVFDVLSFRACLQTPGRIDEAFTREEGLRRLFAVTRTALPPVRAYSDINAMVIKYVIEAKCGMPFAQALDHYILTPAGLSNTYAQVPDAQKERCVCYNYEHRIMGDRLILRCDTPCGTAHDPKAAFLSQDGRDLCGHAGLFSSRADMVRFAQALLRGELITQQSLTSIGLDRTGRDNGDGTFRQFLGYLCFSKHPIQALSEVPAWMGRTALGLSGFTGNHLSIDPDKKRFVLFLGNRCHARVSHIAPPPGKTLPDYGLGTDGVGLVPWPDGRLVPSSARYVHFKDARLHTPIAKQMREHGWL